MPRTEDAPALQDRTSYLSFMRTKTLEHILFISSSLEQQNQQNLLQDFTIFSNILQGYPKRFEDETDDQLTRRCGWMIEAKGAELLDEYGLRSHKQRIAWKNDLAFEILQARQSEAIPGVVVEYSPPYKGYVDEYSQNRIIVRFLDSGGLNGAHHALHAGFNFANLVEQVHGIEQAKSLLAVCDTAEFRPDIQALILLNEASVIRDDLRHHVPPASWKQLKQRLDLFRDLLLSDDSARLAIDVRYQQSDYKYHTFFIQALDERGFRGQIPLQIQPEEVHDAFWDFLRSFINELVPSREDCLKPEQKERRMSSETIPDDDWENSRRSWRTKSLHGKGHKKRQWQ